MPSQINRRRFVRDASLLAGTGFCLASQSDCVLGRSPNERVNVACIGVEGKGSSDTDGAARCGQVVALCDIDDQRLKQKAQLVRSSQRIASCATTPKSRRAISI